MKKFFISTVSLVLFVCLIACNQGSTTKTTASSNVTINDVPLTSLLVDNKIIQADVNGFELLFTEHNMPALKAYTVRASELLAAMGIDTNLVKGQVAYNHIRVYPGYDKEQGYKLYILPVEDADLVKGLGGFDMVFNKDGKVIGRRSGWGGLSKAADGDSSWYGLNLNAPCPNTCPQNN